MKKVNKNNLNKDELIALQKAINKANNQMIKPKKIKKGK